MAAAPHPALKTSICAFATDLADEGVEAVLDNVERRAGLGGLAVAAAYHAARDLFPHNPRRKVGYFLGGALWFPPDERRWDGLAVRPEVAPLARERDVLAETCRAAERRGLEVDAWVVYLHVDRPYPGAAPRNAFGDPYLTDLCPASPAARAYVRALTADVCRYPVGRVLAESIHYHGLDHGGHHEREFVGLGSRARFLLGLCFCEHCLAAAARAGVDGVAVRDAVRGELEAVLAGPAAAEEDGELERDGLAAELRAYVETRTATVTSLAAEAAEVADAAGRRFAFIDPSGAAKGYATGRPTGGPAAEIGWQFGVDVGALARACGQVEAVGYVAEPARLRLDLEAYAALTAAEGLAVALRPSPPDCSSAVDLREKVEAARALGVGRVDFYHYGFVRLEALDWIREALRVG